MCPGYAAYNANPTPLMNNVCVCPARICSARTTASALPQRMRSRQLMAWVISSSEPKGSRQPGQRVELVDVFDVRQRKAAEAEDDASQPCGGPAESQRAAAKNIGETRGQPNMDQRRPDQRLFGLKPAQRPMERVEHGRLRIRQEWHAQEEIRVPKRDMPGGQLGHAIGPIRREVGGRVHAGQHTVGQAQRPQHDKRRRRQRDPRGEAVGSPYGCPQELHVPFASNLSAAPSLYSVNDKLPSGLKTRSTFAARRPFCPRAAAISLNAASSALVNANHCSRPGWAAAVATASAASWVGVSYQRRSWGASNK